MELIRALEEVLATEATIQWCPHQEGDVPATWADVSKAEHLLGYGPVTPFGEGLRQFADWLSDQKAAV